MIKHKRFLGGFTVVELAVVITVMAILATIVTLSYRHVQKSSRDNQRSADIAAFRGALEKFYDEKGVYPPGCSMTTCADVVFTDNTSAPLLNAATSFNTLKTALPSVPAGFGDPNTDNSSSPFFNRAKDDRKYFYFGGGYRRGVTNSYAIPSKGVFPCSLTIYYGSSYGPASSYVTGYYSESEKKWVLYGGKNGAPLAISGAESDGCVLLP